MAVGQSGERGAHAQRPVAMVTTDVIVYAMTRMLEGHKEDVKERTMTLEPVTQPALIRVREFKVSCPQINVGTKT